MRKRILWTLLLSVTVSGIAGAKEASAYMPILMYHQINDERTPNWIAVSSERFREQLSALKEAGFETINEQQLIDFLQGKGTLPLHPVLITIDDGYLDNYENAFPILKELGMKASIYVITNSRGKKPGDFQHFSWAQAEEMVGSGLISIQSHTHDAHYQIPGTNDTHLTARLTIDGKQESYQEYLDRFAAEFRQSKQLIEEHTGSQVVSLSYPYGFFNQDTEDVLKDAGYAMSLTVDKGLYEIGKEPWLLPRITADGRWTGERLVKEIERLYNSLAKAKHRTIITLNGQRTILYDMSHEVNGKMFVPLRTAAGLAGYDMKWNSKSQRVTLSRNEQIVTRSLTPGAEDSIAKDDWFVKQGVTYIWIRTFADLIGASIKIEKDRDRNATWVNLVQKGA